MLYFHLEYQIKRHTSINFEQTQIEVIKIKGLIIFHFNWFMINNYSIYKEVLLFNKANT